MKNIFKKLAKGSQAGFTLIELLIAITIFVTFLVVVSNSYIGIIRAQKTANETREMYSELRNFVDFVNGEMRNGSIDYFCYDPPIKQLEIQADALARCFDSATYSTSSGDNLRTISKDGLLASTIVFEKNGDDGVGKLKVVKFKKDNDSWVAEAGFAGDSASGESQDFAFSNLQVKDLHFDIYPKKDPSKIVAGQLQNQLQPMVVMSVQVASKNPTVKFDLRFQTMITARSL